MHDPDYRILRANRADAECAGISYSDIPGRVYWSVFPRAEGPLPNSAEKPEASILAIADVVEAMSTHRPYRPARGVNEAVDACLTVISENRFPLPDPR